MKKDLKELKEKLESLNSQESRLKLIYEWVKTDLISQKTFLEIMSGNYPWLIR